MNAAETWTAEQGIDVTENRVELSLPANDGSPDSEPRCVALVAQPDSAAASSIGVRLRIAARSIMLGEPIESFS